MSEFDPRSTTDRKDSELDGIIRPQQLDDFTGQKEIVSNLEIYIKAAKMRGEALDHTLFHGPPGLGKTTLAHIIANEMGSFFRDLGNDEPAGRQKQPAAECFPGGIHPAAEQGCRCLTYQHSALKGC